MKFRIFTLILLLVSLTFLISCSDDDDKDIISISSTTMYPMEIGNTWEYRTVISRETLNPADSVVISDCTWVSEERFIVSIEDVDVLEDSLPAYRFTTEFFEGNDFIDKGYHWYRQEDDGLSLCQYASITGSVTPKRNPSELRFNNQSFSSIENLIFFSFTGLCSFEEDSIVYFIDPPELTYPHPVEVGYQWGDSPAIGKTVYKKENIEVEAGWFESYVIETQHFIGQLDECYEEDYIYDWFSSKGLLKRSVGGLVKEYSEQAEFLGLYRLKLDHELIEYSINQLVD